MGTKEMILGELEALIKELDLAPTTVGREIANDPNLLDRLRDPKKTITTKTVDAAWRYVLKMRHQIEMKL